jgi:hypothetical protein
VAFIPEQQHGVVASVTVNMQLWTDLYLLHAEVAGYKCAVLSWAFDNFNHDILTNRSVRLISDRLSTYE